MKLIIIIFITILGFSCKSKTKISNTITSFKNKETTMKSEETYKYQLKSEHGTNKLMIEFITDTDNKNFKNDLKEILLQIDYKVVKKEDLWMNDEILYTCKSKVGEFQISSDNYGGMFILSEDENCIIKLDELLKINTKFIKDK